MSIQSEITRITAQRDAMAAVLETTPPAPAALSRCSEVLETLRQALAENLVTMGVEAAATGSLEVLVPKVLRIPQGDISAEVFLASVLPAFDVSHGFFSTGETASFDGMCTISAVCKATALRPDHHRRGGDNPDPHRRRLDGGDGGGRGAGGGYADSHLRPGGRRVPG
ncbi:MAG: hypothetical protein ACLT09_06895 [Flavonifractor plautii]